MLFTFSERQSSFLPYFLDLTVQLMAHLKTKSCSADAVHLSLFLIWQEKQNWSVLDMITTALYLHEANLIISIWEFRLNILQVLCSQRETLKLNPTEPKEKQSICLNISDSVSITRCLYRRFYSKSGLVTNK